jgi:hypothetical protein
MNTDFGELRRRLKELLAVPEAQRTDPQWDEIIELEVQLAPGNRIGAPTPGTQQQQQPRNRPQGGRNFAPGKPGFAGRKKKKSSGQGQGQGGGQQGGGQQGGGA